MEVWGPHARHLPPRPGGAAPRGASARARPRPPRVRDPDGTRRRRDRDRRDGRRHSPPSATCCGRPVARLLLEAKARGADVRMVYSPLDALALAAQEPDRHVCFFAIGFETTAPATAVTLLRARAEETPNFSVFCNHVPIEPPLRAILETPGLRVDAFVAGARVVGDRHRRLPLHPEEYSRPSSSRPSSRSTSQSIAMLLRQRGGALRGREPVHAGGAARWERAGRRRDRGDDGAARGLRVARAGVLPGERPAGARAVRRFDAERLFALPARIEDPKACRCGEVLTGQIKPWECGVFGTACRPERPLGHVHGVERGRLRRVLLVRPPPPAARGSSGRCLREAAGAARCSVTSSSTSRTAPAGRRPATSSRPSSWRSSARGARAARRQRGRRARGRPAGADDRQLCRPSTRLSRRRHRRARRERHSTTSRWPGPVLCG